MTLPGFTAPPARAGASLPSTAPDGGAGFVDIAPNKPPEMKTAIYAPEIRIVIDHNGVEYDISSDIVALSLRRAENSVASAVWRVSNKGLPGSPSLLRYYQRFSRMDRVVIYLKRLAWVQVFSGYLDSVPYVQLYAGTVNFRASCTLKRLLHTWWDPGLGNSVDIFDQYDADGLEQKLGQASPDAGLGTLLRRVLTRVGGWNPLQVHVQRFPLGYYRQLADLYMQMTKPGTRRSVEQFRRMLLGDGDVSGGTGAAAGRQTGVVRGSYPVGPQAVIQRKLEVLRAVDDMGMGPDTMSMAAAQGVGQVGMVSADEKDKDAWTAQQEVGRNWNEASMKNDAAVHCFMTIMVESSWMMWANPAVPESFNFPNDGVPPTGGDHDSVGLFQQRATGWGTCAQRMNPRESAGMFLKKLAQMDWRNMPRGAACQAVQVSAYPAKYATFEQQAIEEVRAFRTGQISAGQSGDIVSSIGPGAGAMGVSPINVGAVVSTGTALATQDGTPSLAGAGQLAGRPKYDSQGALTYALAQQGKPYQWGGTGPGSFDCIAEGTLIATDRGEVAIEDLNASDRVLTRQGYRRVLRSWKVRDDAEVVSIEVAGRILTGTPDHRVWTENRGWVPLGELDRFDTVVWCHALTSLGSAIAAEPSTPDGRAANTAHPNADEQPLPIAAEEYSAPAKGNESSFKASPTTGIRTLIGRATGLIFKDRTNLSTLRFGSTITVPFRPGMRYTTATTTPSTTISPTLIASTSKNTAEKVRRHDDCTTTFVRSAGSSFAHSEPRVRRDDFVAPSTNRNTTTTATRPRSRVYDVMVEGVHEFFANGVLVHNCSGLTWMAYRSIGLDIGRRTTDQINKGVRVTPATAKPGDLIFPAEADHVVMYVSPGMVVHAPQSGQVVTTAPIWFNPASAEWRSYADWGGPGPAPFDPIPLGPGAIPGTVGTGSSGGTYQEAHSEPIARNLFSYQFEPGIFANGISELFGGSQETREKAFMNDQPLIQTVVSFAKAGMRCFQSAPNGDFVAYYPDYFGLDGKQAVVHIEDIELKDVSIDLNDDALTTHVYVSGSISPNGRDGGALQSMLQSQGVATVENPVLFYLMTRATPQLRGEANLAYVSGMEVMRKFGMRPLSESASNVQSGPMEFLLAVQTFMTKWAEQYATQIQICFMPELFPGMRVNLVGHNLQVYVTEVVHSCSYDEGFTTTITITAPSKSVVGEIQSAGDFIADMAANLASGASKWIG